MQGMSSVARGVGAGRQYLYLVTHFERHWQPVLGLLVDSLRNLLLWRLHLDKAHARPGDRLADRLGVVSRARCFVATPDFLTAYTHLTVGG